MVHKQGTRRGMLATRHQLQSLPESEYTEIEETAFRVEDVSIIEDDAQRKLAEDPGIEEHQLNFDPNHGGNSWSMSSFLDGQHRIYAGVVVNGVGHRSSKFRRLTDLEKQNGLG